MKNDKLIKWSMFILSVICFFICYKQIINLAIYSDEFNTSPYVVLGGEFWLFVSKLEFIMMLVLSILSAINLFKKPKEDIK